MGDATQQQLNLQPSDQPKRESTGSSFRDRAIQRMERERDPGAKVDAVPVSEVQEKVVEQNLDVQPDAHQPIDDGYPTEDLDKTSDDLTDEDTQHQDDEDEDVQTTDNDSEPTGVDNTDVEDVSGEQDITGLRQRAEEAEAMVASMQSDYTKKTQKLGESRRELKQSLEHSAQIAGIYAERANSQLQRYDNVNWTQLQSTLDPQIYSQRANEYRQVVAMRDRAVSEHENISNLAKEQTELQKRDQADISREILQTTLPGWGNELYGKLREYAVDKLNFTQDEFDDFTDHRWIKLIHGAFQISQTGQHVENIQNNGSRNRKPAGKNKRQTRGIDGKYRKALSDHESNPGNRDFTREAFRQRLQRERTGRR